MRLVEEYVGAFEAFEPDGSTVWPRLLKILSKNPFKHSLVREKPYGDVEICIQAFLANQTTYYRIHDYM